MPAVPMAFRCLFCRSILPGDDAPELSARKSSWSVSLGLAGNALESILVPVRRAQARVGYFYPSISDPESNW